MSSRLPQDLPETLRAALEAPWHRPPARLGRRARRLPPGEAAPPAPRPTADGSIPPPDVRGLTPPGAATVQSHSLPGLELTLRLAPADAGLWRLEGRVWREDGRSGRLRLFLTQDEHVLDESRIEDGGAFRFDQALKGAWRLEIHPEDGAPAVLEGRIP